jgi:hypothetical protein
VTVSSVAARLGITERQFAGNKPLSNIACRVSRSDETSVPAAEDVVWDPNGLLGTATPAVGLIERKLAARQAAQAKEVEGPPVQAISPEALAAGGWNLEDGSEQLSKADFATLLSDSFMPVRSSD